MQRKENQRPHPIISFWYSKQPLCFLLPKAHIQRSQECKALIDHWLITWEKNNQRLNKWITHLIYIAAYGAWELESSDSWFNMENLRPPSQHSSTLLPSFSSTASSSSSSSTSLPNSFLPFIPWFESQELSDSWGQLLLYICPLSPVACCLLLSVY